MKRTSLERAIDNIVPAIEQTKAMPRDYEPLRKALQAVHGQLVIVGSGNSLYPGRYLEWLLRHSSPKLRGTLMTPLEYKFSGPRYPHVTVLFSQGARRRDSKAIENLCAERGSLLFLVCGSAALSTGARQNQTVADRLRGDKAVFCYETLGECKRQAFLNITGTAAAFYVAYELVSALECLSEPFIFPSPRELSSSIAELQIPRNPKRVVLHGPAGRAAAEALAGYHCESLGTLFCYDMKNFTHGVWRGLGEAGSHCVLLLADRQVTELVANVSEYIGHDHSCIVVANQSANLTVEPFVMFLQSLLIWQELAHRRALAWSPMSIDMKGRWSRYRGINGSFDLSRDHPE